MAISEHSLHPYIKSLVEQYGSLTVTEINQLLRDILVLDEDDLTLLKGRNDDKFSQIVRNIVSHAPQDVVSNRNGYIIDKTVDPAILKAIDYSSDGCRDAINDMEIDNRKQKIKKFVARKINNLEKSTTNTKRGLAGEMFVVDYERNRLKDLNAQFDVTTEVVHIPSVLGDGLGYDVLSKKDDKGELLYIEVKTTIGDLNTPFYITANEKLFLEINKNDAVIYRVYNFDENTNIGEIDIITYDDLIRDYNFDPTTFKVSRK